MRTALESFYGRRVLVTGHTGFKGSWLAFLLAEIGAEVAGYALPPETAPNHFALLRLDRRIRHIVGDVRDASALASSLQAFQPEYVFHLAAQALVRRSYADPVATFATNFMGSVHLLEAVRRCDSVRSLVYVTSDKCYEKPRVGVGLPRDRSLGRSRSVQCFEGRRRACILCVREFIPVVDPEFGRCVRAGRQRHRGGRLVAGPRRAGLRASCQYQRRRRAPPS